LVRWPGRIQAGSLCNGVVHYRDWLPTLLAVAGEPGAKDRRASVTARWLRACEAHKAGANVLPFLTGHAQAPALPSLTYFDDDGGTLTFRYDNWEIRSGERFAPLRQQVPRPRGLRATEHGAASSPAAKASARRRMHRGTAHRAGAR
jgi:arylsulfatase